VVVLTGRDAATVVGQLTAPSLTTEVVKPAKDAWCAAICMWC